MKEKDKEKEKDKNRSSSSSPPLPHAGLEGIQVMGSSRNQSSPSLRHSIAVNPLLAPLASTEDSISDHLNQSLADSVFSASLPLPLPQSQPQSQSHPLASSQGSNVPAQPKSMPPDAAAMMEQDLSGSPSVFAEPVVTTSTWSTTWALNIEAVQKYIQQKGGDFDSDSSGDDGPLITFHSQSHSMPPPLPHSASSNPYSYSRPGQLKYDSDMRFTFYSESKQLFQANSFSSLSPNLADLMKKESFWLDINRPDDQDMRMIAKIFNIHPLTIEDITSLDPREKCELFDSYVFICLRSTDQMVTSSEFLQPFNLYLIAFPNCLLSISESTLAASVQTRHVLNRLGRTQGLRLSADWLLYALLDDIVDGFMPNIKTMEMEVDSIDDLVLILSESDQRDMLRRIGKARKRVTAMLRLLSPKIEVIKGLVKRAGASGRLAPNTIVYLRDVQDHLMTMTQSLEHFGETLNRSHSNYLAQISIELTQASNRMNSVVKTLSVSAALFLPLTLYAGIWGMNVPVPGQENVGLAQLGPFFAILSSMVLMVIIFCLIARKINWF